jgi:glycosyltransferase involved in cell wall biosynthesis
MIDGAQFLGRKATGIGTYARALASALKASGCAVSVLYGRPVRSGELPLSPALQVFGNDPPLPRWRRPLHQAVSFAAVALGAAGRARAVPVPIDGLDLSAFEPALPACDEVLNADRLFDRAQLLFAMRRRFVRLDAPRSCKAAHWAGPLAIKARGIPNLYTLHDLIPLQFPHFVVDVGARSADLHASIAREADHIVTVSETSKRHIVELLKVPEDRVSVTYEPVPDLPRLARADAERLVESVYGVRPGAYALHLGAIEPKKNLKRLIEAFLLADPRIPLLTVGPLGWLYENDVALMDSVASHARSAGRAPLRRLGYLSRPHVVALLQCARFLVFPSLYEGFGLPVLEAMQLGVPVLTSSAGSLPEVAGDAALLVPPLDVGAMAEEIRRLANDRDLCAELSRRGPAQAAKFSPERYRQRLADTYRKVGVEIDGEEFARAARSREPQKGVVQSQGIAYPPAA